MYRTIVVPLDGSFWSEQALPLACDIAGRAHAELQLVRVYVPSVEAKLGATTLADVPIVDDAWNDERRQQEREELQARADEVASHTGISVSTHLLDGPVAATLATYTAQSGADLVVLTTHGRGGLARVWLGSVVDSLVRQIHIPLLTVRPRDTSAEPSRRLPAHILIPLDGSVWAEQAIAPAMDLGRLLGAKCTLFQVVEPLHTHGYAPGIDLAELAAEATETLCTTARQYLEGVASRIRAADLAVSVRVNLSDNAARAILDEAQAGSIDLVAMATHSRGGLARTLLGSVADKVLRGSDVPVLIFRPADTIYDILDRKSRTDRA
jgi:nucleotide-binding universal stress UspA family protein